MRLNKASDIKSIIRSFDQSAKVYLYGSRTDDSKKGGDIDLLVLSQSIDLQDKIRILSYIYALIGEQRIDLIVAKDLSDPFCQHAFQSGVEL